MIKNYYILVLDIYPAHLSQKIIQTSIDFNIELLFAPAGTIFICQLQKKHIFRELKIYAQLKIQQIMNQNDSANVNSDISFTV
jgi:hypothetical protein